MVGVLSPDAGRTPVRGTGVAKARPQPPVRDRETIPLKVAACVRKHLPRKDLSHQWRDILAFFASGTARMPRVNNRYNDTTRSPAITCATFIRCASYGASHEGCLQTTHHAAEECVRDLTA